MRRDGKACKGCSKDPEKEGISAAVLDMYCVKPFDKDT